LGGSYLLSQLLLPQLKAARDHSRVIFVSSGGMYNSKFPDWSTATSSKEGATHEYDGQFSYVYAKRGQVLLAERLSKEIPDVAWISAHPGWVGTSIVDDAYGSSKQYFEPFRTVWHGTEGIAWLAGVDKKELESGALYLDRLPQQKHFSGPFFTEGSHTRNSEKEVDEMMKKLKEAAGL
jgi:dehydrogenase/reductase SDR family protein 12